MAAMGISEDIMEDILEDVLEEITIIIMDFTVLASEADPHMPHSNPLWIRCPQASFPQQSSQEYTPSQATKCP